jgi:nucleotide-binding universal stress UspA family protein
VMEAQAGAPVVVGVDGSPHSQVAVGLAVRMAAERSRPVRVVHAYTWPPLDLPAMPMPVTPWPVNSTVRAGCEPARLPEGTAAGQDLRELRTAVRERAVRNGSGLFMNSQPKNRSQLIDQVIRPRRFCAGPPRRVYPPQFCPRTRQFNAWCTWVGGGYPLPALAARRQAEADLLATQRLRRSGRCWQPGSRPAACRSSQVPAAGFPVIVDAGRRLFADAGVTTGLRLVDSRTTGSGTAIHVYQRTGRPPFGEIEVG